MIIATSARCDLFDDPADGNSRMRLRLGAQRAARWTAWVKTATIRNPAPVAQLDRVQPSEGWGRTFESSRARQIPSRRGDEEVERSVDLQDPGGLRNWLDVALRASPARCTDGERGPGSTPHRCEPARKSRAGLIPSRHSERQA